MHELSITENILETVLKQLPDKNVKVKQINLKVGEFTFVDPECVRFYFDEMAKNTQAEGAEIKAEKVPIGVKCRQCGAESNLSRENMVFICHICQSKDVELVCGRELFIESIDVE